MIILFTCRLQRLYTVPLYILHISFHKGFLDYCFLAKLAYKNFCDMTVFHIRLRTHFWKTYDNLCCRQLGSSMITIENVKLFLFPKVNRHDIGMNKQHNLHLKYCAHRDTKTSRKLILTKNARIHYCWLKFNNWRKHNIRYLRKSDSQTDVFTFPWQLRYYRGIIRRQTVVFN